MKAKTKNIVILSLAILLAVSIAAHFLVPYYQGKMQSASQQAAQQAVVSTLMAIQQRVISVGEAVIETQQGKMVLIEKPTKKGKGRK